MKRKDLQPRLPYPVELSFRIEGPGVLAKDGSIGRNPSLPHTTKRRITINLKSINNQKHHKNKLQGTPTTKELKKKNQPEQPDL